MYLRDPLQLLKASSPYITVILLWISGVAIAHHWIHELAPQINAFLINPLQKLIAASTLLTITIYLFIFSLPKLSRPGLKTFIAILMWTSLVIIGHGVTHIGGENAEIILINLNQMIGIWGFIGLAIAYSIFLAIPFIAGVEIGLLLMAIFGYAGVAVAYIGTIIGLNLAFLFGRLIPSSIINKLATRLHLDVSKERFKAQLEQASIAPGTSITSKLLRSRYITLAVLYNLPANSIVGGGGGISLLAGANRKLFTWRKFLCVSILAPLPIPLLAIAGLMNLEKITNHSGILHDFLTRIYQWLPF